jgi:hypothetical protein
MACRGARRLRVETILRDKRTDVRLFGIIREGDELLLCDLEGDARLLELCVHCDQSAPNASLLKAR